MNAIASQLLRTLDRVLGQQESIEMPHRGPGAPLPPICDLGNLQCSSLGPNGARIDGTKHSPDGMLVTSQNLI